MSAGVVGRARASHLLQGSAWILVGLGIQAVLGFAFWVLGARVASSSELGQASALFTAIQFVNYASGLGLTIALARHAALKSQESDALFGWALVATVISSVIGGGLYLAIVDTSATALVDGSPAGWALFCAYTAGLSIGLLADVRFMAARRWGWLIGRIAVVSLIRIPLLAIPVQMDPALWLYTLMLAPAAIGGVLAVPLLWLIGSGGVSLRRPATLRPVARYAGVNWGATLASQAPQYVLPLVVAQSVASATNASFFLAWTVTGLVFLVPAAIAQVLLVEGGKEADTAEEGAEQSTVREHEALVFSLGLSTVAWLGSLVAGPVIAKVFGSGYDRLATLLPALMVAGIPWAITSVRLSEARIRKDQLATVAITLTLGLGIVLPAVLLVPSGGTAAATSAWIFGNVAGAVVASVMHARHRRTLRRPAVA